MQVEDRLLELQYYKKFLSLSATEKQRKTFMPLLKQTKGHPLNSIQNLVLDINRCTAHSNSLSVVHCSMQQQKEQGLTASI